MVEFGVNCSTVTCKTNGFCNDKIKTTVSLIFDTLHVRKFIFGIRFYSTSPGKNEYNFSAALTHTRYSC